MKKLLLRLKTELWDKLKESAELNERSINAEIVTAIKKHLK